MFHTLPLRKRLLGLASLILLSGLGCGRPASTEAPVDDTITPPPPVEMVTTAIDVEPNRHLPAGYVLDSTSMLDSATQHQITLFFPKSTTDTALNATIRAFCEAEAAKSIPDEPRGEMENSNYDMWPISVEVKGDLLSILFQDQSFYSGAAHFVHGYVGLNLNLPTRSALKFADLIRFIGQKPRMAFCDLVNGQNQNSDALTPESLTPDLDFAIQGDQLLLCFDDYDLGPSQTQLTVALADVQSFLTARATKILKL